MEGNSNDIGRLGSTWTILVVNTTTVVFKPKIDVFQSHLECTDAIAGHQDNDKKLTIGLHHDREDF